MSEFILHAFVGVYMCMPTVEVYLYEEMTFYMNDYMQIHVVAFCEALL